MDKGLLVVISGPSGTGKGTVISHMLKENSDVKLSVSATTREPREGEQNGVNYHFLTRDDFEDRIENGGMLEHAQYCDNYYGTPLAPIVEWQDKGNDVILEIEVQGGAQVKEKVPDSVTIFILPPSVEELENRLRGRGTEDEETIQKRLETALAELQEADKYDFNVINNDVAETADIIMQIINKEKSKR